MTIRKPNFVLVDECPDWCTIDHKRTSTEPGEHIGQLVENTQIMTTLSTDVSLIVEDGSDVRVDLYVSNVADQVTAQLPLSEARDALLKLAQVYLTAAYRLDIIEAAEESTTSDKVTYRIDFGPELLPLDAQTLLRISTAEHAPEVAAALEDGDFQGAAEAFLGSLDRP
ncbi:hypothetical protein [Nocardioides caldifontis]|uniref:hypothetical protein n=1 Tax=Nocardioides caldifontis TaxID=2588938 RepID=UPI0011DF4C63|nr:hypothetical protein [Nocardioides caldifontis]